MPDLALAGGGRMPVLGLGTWQLRGEACERIVRAALDAGYTHIDTAEGYGNEEEIGRAIRGWDRERLWVTSKVWRERLRPPDLRESCEACLRRLGTEYLDLFLVHWPNSDIPIGRTVEGFRALVEEGMIRRWGVSNFTERHLREAVAHGVPATNQVELHPYFNQRPLARVCRELGVPITAYTPLARGRVTEDEILRSIGASHGATAAQVALAWGRQRGYALIPKTSREERLAENLGSLEVVLSEPELARIDDRPQRGRLVDGAWSEF